MELGHVLELIIADDHYLFRRALIAFMDSDPQLSVIGEAVNGIQLIELLKIRRPHIIIIDLEMPVMSGIAAIEYIRQNYPLQKIIVLSQHNNPLLMKKLISCGVSSYLPKHCDPDDLIFTIKDIYKSDCYYSPSPGKGSMPVWDEGLSDSIKHQVTLSMREIGVVKLVCEGKTNREIAIALGIREGTVEFHKRNIYKKTHSESIPALIKYALRKGIVDIS